MLKFDVVYNFIYVNLKIKIKEFYNFKIIQYKNVL